MSDLTKYNDLFDSNVFTNPNDRDARIGLFLDTVQTLQDKRLDDRANTPEAEKTMYPVFDLTHNMFTNFISTAAADVNYFNTYGVPETMQNGNFTTKISNDAANLKKIHPEWAVIIIDILLNIKLSGADPVISPKKIRLLNELASEVDSGRSRIRLLKNVVRALFKLNDGVADLPENASSDLWATIRSYSFNPNARKYIFGEDAVLAIDDKRAGLAERKPVTEVVVYDDSDGLRARVVYQFETTNVDTPSGLKDCGYKLIEYITKLIFNPKVTDTGSEHFFDDITSTVKTYYRDANGALYINDNGIKKTLNDDYFKQKYKNNDLCKASGLDANPAGGQCTRYILDCLNGTDVKKCKSYLENNATPFLMKDEIKNMSPELIIKTVTALDLPIKLVFNSEFKATIREIGSYDEWIDSLNTKLDPAEVTNIKQNARLRKYIQYLTSFIKQEPALLNEGLVMEKNKFDPNMFSGTTLFSYGMKPNYPLGYMGPTDLSPADIDRLEQIIIHKQNSNKLAFGLRNTLGIRGMHGGDPYNILKAVDNESFRTSPILKNYFLRLLNTLELKNKRLDTKDQEDINKYLEGLEKSELSVLKSIKYVNEYIKLLNNYGERDGNKVLKLEYLKKFVEERNNKLERLGKKQLNGLAMIRTVAVAQNDLI